jgi:hypothetical protein
MEVRGMRSESEMTHEEIVRMAEEAGIGNAFSLEKNQYVYRFGHKSVERFAALVAAAEREACAKVCDDIDTEYEGEDVLATWCAAAIRARGEE